MIKIKHGNYYTYATAGVGPAPEAIRSTQPENTKIFREAILYFKSHPKENPHHRYWHQAPVSEPYYKQLTNLYYQQDRQVRASGYDLSGRFGVVGQHIGDYGNLALTSLLYQMGKDLRKGNALFSESGHKSSSDFLKHWLNVTKYQIQHNMWHQLTKHTGLFIDLPKNRSVPIVYNGYPFGTMFYPVWAGAASKKQYNALLRYAMTRLNIHKIALTFNFKEGETKGDVIKGTVSEKRMPSYLNGKGAIVKSAMLAPYGVMTSLVNSGNQWDYPNSWAPVNYFAEHALLHKEFSDHQSKKAVVYIQNAWINAVTDYFAKKGTIVEKYNALNPLVSVKISHGYSATVVGFGWTNALFIDFYNRAS